MDFLRFILSGFWVFIGFIIIMYGILDFIFKMWNRYWRHKNIRIHGYPPEHCDADGDFLIENKDDE
jgi:hypothetical protein